LTENMILGLQQNSTKRLPFN